MAGHSKFANIKHKKARNDAQKGKIFTKLGRELAVAVKTGGGADPSLNRKLADVIAKAKASNMPNDTIDRSIKKAAGDNDGANYEAIVYEGYGPEGIAVIVECLTDNLNRTAADVRSAFTHAGGNLGTSGSVTFQFMRKGALAIDKVIRSDDKKVPDKDNAVDEDEFMMAVAEAEGDDYEDNGEQWIVYTAYDRMQDVQKALEAQGIEVKGSELTMVPTTPTELELPDARKVQRLVDRLEELDDVQSVYSTMSVSDEVAEQLADEE